MSSDSDFDSDDSCADPTWCNQDKEIRSAPSEFTTGF